MESRELGGILRKKWTGIQVGFAGKSCTGSVGSVKFVGCDSANDCAVIAYVQEFRLKGDPAMVAAALEKINKIIGAM